MLVVILILLHCLSLFLSPSHKFKYYSYTFNISHKYFITAQHIHNDPTHLAILLRGRGRSFTLKQFCIPIGWNDKGSTVRFRYPAILQPDYEVPEDVPKPPPSRPPMTLPVPVEDDQACLIGYDYNRSDTIAIRTNHFFVNLLGMFLKVLKCGFHVFLQ